MRRAFSNILLTNQVFPEFVGPQTMNEDGVSNCKCVASYLSLFQMIYTVWKCAVHIGVYELGVVGVVLCKWFDDGFHLHSPTSLH
jgi:hypothetical protein